MTITGYLGSLEQENQRLQAELNRVRADLNLAYEWMDATRDACAKATGGNTTFIDDDVARAIRKLMSELDRLRAEVERLRDMLAYIAEHDPDKRGLHGEMIDVLRSAVASAKAALVFPDPL